MNEVDFSIHSTLKKTPKINRSLFCDVKSAVLGKDYELSLVFVGEKKIKNLNNKWREKNYPTDILSFSVSEKNGEIFINPEQAEKKSKIWNKKLSEYIPFLFVHGLFHLKGMEHGSRMESEEKKIREKFNI